MTDSQPNRSDETADLPRSQAPTPPSAASIEQPGDEVGPYKLLSLVGEGGFGVVWIAERRAPFSQRVALKFLKPGMDSKAVLARFEQERQALALMDHPHVARVFDGGMTPAGRPYFAMELVKGEPINVFCDRNRLTVRERLRLFVQVCDAVQHAHMKGIIHRDLKPSNILVSSEGDRPNAKVIDFGVAKAIAQRLTEHTVFTETGQMIGTPEYMSPEQAEPGATDIDTRSDVYSLGVILYELLAGATPFDSRELRSKAYREIQRIIREVDPPAPSTRLSTIATRDADTAAQIAAQRGERIATLANLLKSELEWIPLKAMRKDRRERYGSAADLARDIDAYLDGKPIVAAPESASYRARKFVRRNRGKVAATASVAAALVAGLAASLLLLREANLQRARAEEREQETRAALDFQHRQLSTIDQQRAGIALFDAIERQARVAMANAKWPAPKADDAIRSLVESLQLVNPTDISYALVAGEILERSATIVEDEYRDAPLLQSDLFTTIGRTYLELGKPEPARAMFERARTLRAGRLGLNHRKTLEARDWLLKSREDSDAAAALDEAKALLAERRSALGDDDPDTVESMRTLSALLWRAGRRADAIAQRAEAQAASTARAPRSAESIVDLADLGDLLREAGRLDESVAMLSNARKQLDALHGAAGERLSARVLVALGLALTAEGQPDDRWSAGIALLKEANRLDERIDGKQHWRSFDSRSDLALRLADDGERRAEAIEILETSKREGDAMRFQPNSYLLGLNDLARVRFLRAKETGDAELARDGPAMLDLARGSYQKLVARTGFASEYALKVAKNIASMHTELGQPGKAEEILRPVIDERVRALGKPGDFVIQNLKCDLAIAVAMQGRWQEAVEVLSAAQADAERDLPMVSDGRWITSCKLLRFLEHWSATKTAPDLGARIESQRQIVASLATARRLATPPKQVEIDQPDHTLPSVPPRTAAETTHQ